MRMHRAAINFCTVGLAVILSCNASGTSLQHLLSNDIWSKENHVAVRSCGLRHKVDLRMMELAISGDSCMCCAGRLLFYCVEAILDLAHSRTSRSWKPLNHAQLVNGAFSTLRAAGYSV